LLARLPELSERSAVVPLAVSQALLSAEPRPVPSLLGRRFALVVGDASARKNLPLLVNSWDRITSVALCPSRLEGFGLPAAEALAFGAPLITSTDAALCEVSGDRGQHLDPDASNLWVDAVAKALDAPRAQPPLRAADHSRRTWDEVADETVGVVRRRLA